MRQRLDLRVYAITDGDEGTLVDRVSAAVAGGATAIQLRAKGVSGRGLWTLGRALLPVCRQAGAKLIINDRLDVALAVEADGVHLGPDDLPVGEVRRWCPPGFLIGASAGTPEAARLLEAVGVDYIGVGAIFDAHPSKANASGPRGVAVLSEVKRCVKIPVVAIGGVTLENAAACIEAGADGVAVIRAVFCSSSSDAVELAAMRLRREVDRALEQRARGQHEHN